MTEPERIYADAAHGLTGAQVALRKSQGCVNTQPPTITKSTARIWREHLCTFFNLINILIFLCLLFVQSYTNLMFMGVVLANLLIGVIQEIRSKRTIEKLSLLNMPTARVIRDGNEETVPCEELVLDDIVSFKLGDQIPTDCVVLAGAVEADESLLTGESKPLVRRDGDALLSGSVIVAGTCRGRVEKVGVESYAASLTLEAKKPRKTPSKLMRSMRLIIRVSGMLVLPLGLMMFLRSYLESPSALQSAVEQAAASMLGMIPAGLMLLTSVSLAVGVITLSRKSALVQETYSIETLARVDMLCLDKTGTLTTGDMLVADVQPLHGMDGAEIERIMAAYVSAVPPDNATAHALHARFRGQSGQAVHGVTPFSSARRYSAAAFSGFTIYVGAPDTVCPGDAALIARAHALAEEGYRVVVAAKGEGHAQEPPPIAPGTAPLPIALLLLQDEIRPEAEDTLRFFRDEDVEIKIISGDDPATVSHIAQRLKLPGGEKYIDVSRLQDENAIMEAALQYTVFGRVSPQAKRTICRALQQQGHTVAMTGDGVNDLLALRAADCSIALYTGNDAARQASHIVLLKNDFSVLPNIVMEGRRVINNITRTASLFLVKTIYSYLLTISSVIFGLPYPFQPVQLSLISVTAVGIPSFFLALEPNRTRIEGNFLKNVISNALPGAVLIYLYAMLAGVIGPKVGLAYEQVNTLCVFLTGTAGLCVLLRVCLPFDRWRGVLWGAMAALFFGVAFILPNFLGLSLKLDSAVGLMMYGIMAACCYPLLLLLSKGIRYVLRRIPARAIRIED